MAGYDQQVLDHVIRIARGSRNNIVLLDGCDVALLFEGSVGLVDTLTAKIDATEQERRMWRLLLLGQHTARRASYVHPDPTRYLLMMSFGLS
jgi:hypothetical protein